MRFFSSRGDAPTARMASARLCPHGLIADQAEVLEDHADRPAHIGDLFFSDAAHGKAVDHHAAGGGHHLTGHQLDDGGLTGAGGPHQKDEFSVVHGKETPFNARVPLSYTFSASIKRIIATPSLKNVPQHIVAKYDHKYHYI